MIIHQVDDSNIGELCQVCKEPASHKVEETLFDDDYHELWKGYPVPLRHPFTTRLCCEHFWMIMGYWAHEHCKKLSIQKPLTSRPNVL